MLKLVVLVTISWLWIYAICQTILQMAVSRGAGAMTALCHADTILRNTFASLQLYIHLFLLLELAYQVNWRSTKRVRCPEYISITALLLGVLGLFGYGAYRGSGSSKDASCATGLPRDVLLPVIAVVAAYTLYTAFRVCYPLLRINDAAMKAWGLRVAIGVIVTDVSSLAMLTTLLSLGPYIYTTLASYVVLVGVTSLVVCEAYLIDWRPPYKAILARPQEIIKPDGQADEEAQLGQGERPICLHCNAYNQASTLVDSEEGRSVNHGRTKRKALSILDSKSVAEFVLKDENTVMPEFIEAEMPPLRPLRRLRPLALLDVSSMQATTPDVYRPKILPSLSDAASDLKMPYSPLRHLECYDDLPLQPCDSNGSSDNSSIVVSLEINEPWSSNGRITSVFGIQEPVDLEETLVNRSVAGRPPPVPVAKRSLSTPALRAEFLAAAPVSRRHGPSSVTFCEPPSQAFR
jgi:hypothetical protein